MCRCSHPVHLCYVRRCDASHERVSRTRVDHHEGILPGIHMECTGANDGRLQCLQRECEPVASTSDADTNLVREEVTTRFHVSVTRFCAVSCLLRVRLAVGWADRELDVYVDVRMEVWKQIGDDAHLVDTLHLII